MPTTILGMNPVIKGVGVGLDHDLVPLSN
jgi:hypothetical protein